jgi:large subunit ribosomal protein L6
MSRIGNRRLTIPQGVEVNITENTVSVKGPKGEQTLNISSLVKVAVEENEVVVTKTVDNKESNILSGTTNANIKNMMIGVSEGYSKSLEIIGVGYRFNMNGSTLVVHSGKSHVDELNAPEGLSLELKGNNQVTVSGIDKAMVGQFAAEIRGVRPPEPYKGKGIRYVGEYIRRKEGKKAK